MDILAHSLWTNVVFYKKFRLETKQRLLAVFFGILPDLVSFVPSTVYLLFVGKRFSPALFGSDLWVFKYAEASYNYSHSMVIFLGIALLIFIVRKGNMYLPMWGWALHIVIDIFTHKNFYETPFLFPVSGFRFSHGISWAHPTFMLVNYLALATVYVIWFLVLRKKYAKK
jgi:hypothetical protein